MIYIPIIIVWLLLWRIIWKPIADAILYPYEEELKMLEEQHKKLKNEIELTGYEINNTREKIEKLKSNK